MRASPAGVQRIGAVISRLDDLREALTDLEADGFAFSLHQLSIVNMSLSFPNRERS